MKTNGDELAFPESVTIGPAGDIYKSEVGCNGLTKLEFFSALAMQGVIHSWQQTVGLDGVTAGRMCDQVAARSVQFARALIAELNKEKERG